MPRLVLPYYTIIRDSRERAGHGWVFHPDDEHHFPPKCLGTQTTKLEVGDYSILGYEDLFVVERKADLAELWVNYGERERFETELDGMKHIPHKFIIVETVLTKDSMSLTPPQFTKRVPGRALQEWLSFLTIKYNIPVLFEGQCAQQKFKYLARQVVRKYKDKWATK